MQRFKVVEETAGHVLPPSAPSKGRRCVGTAGAGEVHIRALVFAAAVISCAALLLSGCSFSFSVSGGTPTVAKADLQNDITKKFEGAGETPQSVSCRDDLEGVVGSTVRCEVVVSATNAIEAIVEVTKVDGTTVSYVLTMAWSQAQLEKAVSGLVTQNSNTSVESVTCESGIAGKVGNQADCTVVGDGDTIPVTVKVTKVDSPLLMNIAITPR